VTVALVELVAGTAVPNEQRQRFLEEPGLGAVVLEDGAAVLVHQRLLEWVPRREGDDPSRWLSQLWQRLEAKGYRVEDSAHRPWAPPRLPGVSWPVRARRAALRLIRTPPRQRVSRARRKWRRRTFLLRLRWEAWLAGTQLVLDVAEDLRVEPGVRVELRPGPARLAIGPRTRIASGVLLRLGGELIIGPNCELRHDLVLNVKGRLELQGRNVFGVGVMVHADLPLTFEWGAMVAEYATILDTDHEFDGTLVNMFDQTITARQVHIGACSFLGSKSSVMPGVTVGRRCVVGAGSVVTKDLPEGWIATGIPAKPVRRLADPDAV
jgi:acetyltransferase-like isoleucine patch superfamily enzyme